MTNKFQTYYLDTALFDLQSVVDTAAERLKGVEFDTLVGTGFSGGIVIPTLALTLKKNFVLIRKEGDDSHHGGGRLLGQLGWGWIFVDDFIASGGTRYRVIGKIADAVVGTGQSTRMIGQYLYGRYADDDGPKFQPFERAWLQEGSR